MSKRKKSDRRKSSNSDHEDLVRKHSRKDKNLNQSVSEAISEANNVLYDTSTPDPTSD